MDNQIFFGVLIIITVLCNTVAQALLKIGSGQNPLNIYLLGGLLFYGLSTIFYITVLGKYNLSIAYPLVIGLTMIATTIVSAVMFREKISHLQWIGIGLMLSAISAITLAQKN